MRATVLTEVVDKKSGKVSKRIVQPSRSFTEGLMHCLYAASSQVSTTEPRAVGYIGGNYITGTGAEQLHSFNVEYAFRVTGGPMNANSYCHFPSLWGGALTAGRYDTPLGILFGEGNAPVSSYDRSLEKPLGINYPAPVNKSRFDTLMEASARGCFDAVTDQWYFINHNTNPNKIYCFDTDGVWQSTVATDRTETTSGYSVSFVHGGFLYAYRTSPRNLYKIDLALGTTVLARNIGAELGGSGDAYSMWYDSVAGNIVCISGQSGGVANLGRWSLADFTLAVAAAPINCDRCSGKTVVTCMKMIPLSGTFDWALGQAGASGVNQGWMLLDVVNHIVYPRGVRVQDNTNWYTSAGSGIDSKGWINFAHSGTAAVLMKQCKIYMDLRNLRLLPTYCNLVEADAVSGYFDIVGSMENNTGAAITVAEVGIHAASGPMNGPLIARDVLAVPVAVPAGQVIRTTYRLSASI